MHRLLLATLAAGFLWTVAAGAQADASCDSSLAQNLVRQGYADLDQQRYQEARSDAGQLALFAKGCDNPKVGYPAVVYSAYIGAVALHGLGDDAKASQAAQMGMLVLNTIKSDSQFASLINAMTPRFSALEAQLKQPVSSR